MKGAFHAGGAAIGDGKLCLIAGPCLAESEALCLEVAGGVAEIARKFDIRYIFKASADKANRTSANSERGRGIQSGLAILSAVKAQMGLPITTDIHTTDQATDASEVVDLLQIPAFLCRQTDLLMAAAKTGLPVNVKKGQFLSPWDAKNIVDKLRSFHSTGIMLTERGTTFGYNALVVDMPGLEIMHSFDVPVCFDATHAAQRPGSAGASTGGARDTIPAMVRAACAVGIDALFLEIHPNPSKALSDSETQWPLNRAAELIESAVEIHAMVSTLGHSNASR